MFVNVSRMMKLVACYCLCYHPPEHVTAKYKSHDTSCKKTNLWFCSGQFTWVSYSSRLRRSSGSPTSFPVSLLYPSPLAQGDGETLVMRLSESRKASSDISNTRKNVSSHFQTPRSRLKKREAAEFF